MKYPLNNTQFLYRIGTRHEGTRVRVYNNANINAGDQPLHPHNVCVALSFHKIYCRGPRFSENVCCYRHKIQTKGVCFYNCLDATSMVARQQNIAR